MYPHVLLPLTITFIISVKGNSIFNLSAHKFLPPPPKKTKSTVLLNCFLPTVQVSLELSSSEHKQVRISLVVPQHNMYQNFQQHKTLQNIYA